MKCLKAGVLALLTFGCGINPDEFPFVQPPAAIIDQQGFIEFFKDTCLRNQRTKGDLNTLAKGLGLIVTKETSDGDVNHTVWEASEERGWSPLTLTVQTHPVIYEAIGDGSGLPIFMHSCSLSAYLKDNETKQTASLSMLPLDQLNVQAKAMNQNTFATHTNITKDDIIVKVTRPQKSIYAASRPIPKCQGLEQCSFTSATKLTLEVVLERLP